MTRHASSLKRRFERTPLGSIEKGSHVGIVSELGADGALAQLEREMLDYCSINLLQNQEATFQSPG